MRLNERVRKKLVDELDPGESIRATVVMANQIGTGYASGGGVVHQGATVLSTAYATRLGIDFDDPRLRGDLVLSWCTVTDRRIMFHKPKDSSIRPTPGKMLDELPLDGARLQWFDQAGLGVTNRVLHFDFPDDTLLLSATMLKAKLRRKPFNDEPELLVLAFGDRAAEVANA